MSLSLENEKENKLKKNKYLNVFILTNLSKPLIKKLNLKGNQINTLIQNILAINLIGTVGI